LHAKDYAAVEALRNGRMVEIRALQPDDREGLLAAVDRTSRQSLYRRFFSFKRSFTDQEIDFYVNVDFVNHVALAALQQEDGHPVIVGGARDIMVQQGSAEVAFVVDDAHQGQGIGGALMRHLTAIARQNGFNELTADVLPENAAMLKVFEASGLPITTRREPGVTHVTLQLRGTPV